MMEIITDSAAQTGALAKLIAHSMGKNLVICLEGDLGAGKTLFTQCFAAALKVNETVTSPTFNLMNVYEGTKRIYHFDLYRLESEADLYEIGFYEYTDIDDENEVVLIEWPDRFMECMPEDYLHIKIERWGAAETGRKITLAVHGDKYLNLYKELEKSCQF